MNSNRPLSRWILTLAVAAASGAGLPSAAQTPSTNSQITLLTFDPPAGDLVPVPDTYGDRVTSASDAWGNQYGPGSGGTSNITVEFGPPGSHVRKGAGPYANINNLACQEDGDFGVLEVTLTADPGYQVALRWFDLAAMADDVFVPRVEVLGAYDTMLHARNNLLVRGLGGGRTRLTFPGGPVVSSSVVIRVDLSALANTDSHLVGIDNIAFSEVTGTGCPPPPRLSVARSGNDLVLTWPGTGYRLETTTSLVGGAAWTTLGLTSPVTVQPRGSSGFFRLTCP